MLPHLVLDGVGPELHRVGGERLTPATRRNIHRPLWPLAPPAGAGLCGAGLCGAGDRSTIVPSRAGGSGGRLEEVCVGSAQVRGGGGGGRQELPRVSRLLPLVVAECEVQQVLLETDNGPPVLSLPHTEGGELGEPGLHNLQLTASA